MRLSHCPLPQGAAARLWHSGFAGTVIALVIRRFLKLLQGRHKAPGMSAATWLGCLTGSALAEAYERMVKDAGSQARGYLWGDDSTRASVSICQFGRDDQRPLPPFLHSVQGHHGVLPYPMQQSSGPTTTCAESPMQTLLNVLGHMQVLNEGRHACTNLHGRYALLRVSQDANIPTCTPLIILTLKFEVSWQYPRSAGLSAIHAKPVAA